MSKKLKQTEKAIEGLMNYMVRPKPIDPSNETFIRLVKSRLASSPPRIHGTGYKSLVGLLWWIVRTHFRLKKLDQSVIYTITLPVFNPTPDVSDKEEK
jgi:hypothetical protein